MSEENKSTEFNNEIADKIIKVNQRAKDELVAREFVLNMTKDKSYKKKPPTNWRLISIIILGLALSASIIYWSIPLGEEPLAEFSSPTTAVFILNSDYDNEEFNEILKGQEITFWTKDKKLEVSREHLSEDEFKESIEDIKQYKEMTTPGNYKRLKDFFDYCRLKNISNIHLFGDLGHQNETDIDINNLNQYIMIDREFWEYFKNADTPTLRIHDKGKYSNIKERIIKRRDEVLSEK